MGCNQNINKALLRKITRYYDVVISENSSVYSMMINGKNVNSGNCVWLGFGNKLPDSIDETDRSAVDAYMEGIKEAIQIDPADLLDALAKDKEKALAYRNRPIEVARRKSSSLKIEEMCNKAFGVLDVAFSTSGDSEADLLADKYGIDTSLDGGYANLGNGEFAYIKLISQSIDDYEIMVVKTKGRRSESDLLDFTQTRSALFEILWSNNWDLKKANIVCWETGIEYGFWDIRVEKHLSAWEALKQRVEYFNDSFGGE